MAAAAGGAKAAVPAAPAKVAGQQQQGGEGKGVVGGLLGLVATHEELAQQPQVRGWDIYTIINYNSL